MCSTPLTSACDVCTTWSNLILNATVASGCRSITFKCVGFTLDTINLGCFTNTGVIPRCFGSCPNQCNFNGICVNGFCQCNQGYQGTSCDSPSAICPNNCGGSLKGSCQNGACVCTPLFYGPDCSQYIAVQASSGSNNAWETPVIVVVVLVVVLGIIGIIVFVVYKKRQEKRFSTQKDASGYSTED